MPSLVGVGLYPAPYFERLVDTLSYRLDEACADPLKGRPVGEVCKHCRVLCAATAWDLFPKTLSVVLIFGWESY